MASTATTANVILLMALAGCLQSHGNGAAQVTTDCPELDVASGTYLYVHVTTGSQVLQGAAVRAVNGNQTHEGTTNQFGCALIAVEPGAWNGVVTLGSRQATFAASVAEREISQVTVVL